MKLKNQKEEWLDVKFNSRILLLCIKISWLACYSLSAQANFFLVTPEISQAYQLAHSGKLAQAKHILEAQSIQMPNNVAIDYTLHFANFIEVFILEDESNYKAFVKQKNVIVQRFKQCKEDDPHIKFALAEVYFFTALNQGKMNDLYDAAICVKNAFKLLSENQKSFPDFIPNQKTLGLMKAYISVVPSNYAWFTKTIGFSGTLEEGIEMLDNVIYSNYNSPLYLYWQKEAIIYKAFIQHHLEKKPENAWKTLDNATQDFNTNLLSAYFRASIAQKAKMNEAAIYTLKHKPSSDAYIYFPHLEYLRGLSELRALNPEAQIYFQKFLDTYKGKNYQKACLQQLTFSYVLAGKLKEAKAAQQRIKTIGNTTSEEDLQAQLFSSNPLPNIILLKARLLYDGGNFTKARDLIKPYKGKNFIDNGDKIEYYYRKGRIYEALENDSLALAFYELCINASAFSPHYYGAFSCLYVADYYLSNAQKAKAKIYYEKALSFKNNKEYKESIERRAKVGLKRAR